MKNITDLAGLIRDYGPSLYGSDTPEYIAALWAEALPGADLVTFHEWFDRGFWNPTVARELSAAEVSPWEVPHNEVYDLCNGDLSVAVFLHARGFDHV